MDRRSFIAQAFVTVAGSGLGALAAPRPALAEESGRFDRVTILVEFAGGNDGLNTVVPYADPLYARARPRLALARDTVLQLDERLGLHPSLAPLMPAWRERELAVVSGVGYARPNRSHFRSIDIWETGSDSDRVLSDGWIARLFQTVRRPADGLDNRLADAIIIGGDDGPARGAGMRNVVLRNPEQFLRGASRLEASAAAGGNPALAHILGVERQVLKTASFLRGMQTQARAPALGVSFPRSRLSRQLELAAKLIAAEGRVPVIKVIHPGFDTHARQSGRHRILLAEFADAVAAFRTAMINTGHWQRVLVMTYSEFGRRAAENGNRGTDHGTAAPQFVLGGAVKGGLYGAPPRLDDLDGGDLKFSVDFRRLYATVAERWWSLSGVRDVLGPHRPLPFV